MAKSLAFAQFMSNQGLSHSDICEIFQCTVEESRNWANGNTPQGISNIAIIINQVLERQRLRDMPDIDRQHFEHRSELIIKENETLKAQNARLKKAVYEYEKSSRSMKPKGVTKDATQKRTQARTANSNQQEN